MRYSEHFAHQHAPGKSTWHIEWCTKYRYKVFKKVFKSEYHKNICIIALEEAAKKARVVLLECEVEPEHLRMVAELPLTAARVSPQAEGSAPRMRSTTDNGTLTIWI